jgi:hypothetical protein
MARPTTLPGIMAPLAGGLGVSGLAEALTTNPRTLNNWANNISAMPAIEAGLLADLCKERNVTPMLYTHPNLANGYVASTPEGWVMWTWGLPPAGYAKRSRYIGHLEGLVPAGSEVLCMARTHGWPW